MNNRFFYEVDYSDLYNRNISYIGLSTINGLIKFNSSLFSDSVFKDIQTAIKFLNDNYIGKIVKNMHGFGIVTKFESVKYSHDYIATIKCFDDIIRTTSIVKLVDSLTYDDLDEIYNLILCKNI